MIRQRADSECFGRVVAGVNHCNPSVVGGDGCVVWSFADDQRIKGRALSFEQRLGRCAGSGA